MPKSEIRRKSEVRSPKPEAGARGWPRTSVFGLRACFGLRLSVFGFLLLLLALRAQPATVTNHVLELDGLSGYVELPPNIFNALDEATIEAWVKWERLGGRGWNRVFNYGRGGRDLGLANLGADGAWLVAAEPGGDLRQVVAPGALRVGTWVHVAAVLGRGGMRLYLNGTLAGTDAYPGGFAQLGSGTWNRLGKTVSDNPADLPFKGALDEVRVWRVARTEAQIRATLEQKLTGQEPGLAALWNFDDPADPGRDASPGAQHGELRGQAKVLAAPSPALAAPGDSETGPGAVEVRDEPLAALQPVEQRATHLLRLDGDNGALLVPALAGLGADGNSSHTVEAWLRPHVAPRVRSWPLALGQPGPGSHRWLLGADGQAQIGSAAPTALPIGKWTHVAATWDAASGICTVYFNGQAVGKTRLAAGVNPASAAPLWLGRRGLGEAEDTNFQGDVAELRLWNRARSREEIREDLSAQREGEDGGWGMEDGVRSVSSILPLPSSSRGSGQAGLVGHWTFAETNAPGYDASPSHRHGVLTRGAQVLPIGTPFPVEPPGTEPVLALDGKTGYLELPPNLFNTLEEATVEAWVKWERLGGPGWNRLFTYGAAGHDLSVATLGNDSLWFIVSDPAQGFREITVPGALGTGEWVHVAAVSGPAGMKLYLNGTLVGSNSYAGSFAALKNGTLNRLGKTVTPNEQDPPLQGQVAEFRVWRVARTEAQIREFQWLKLTGKEPGLAALWNFDAVTNGVVRDLGPGAHHGRLEGGATVVLAHLPAPSAAPALLTGRITGAPGEPAAGAEVVVFADGQEWQRGGVSSAGEYRLRFPASSNALRVLVALRGFSASATVPALRPGERRELDLALAPPPSVLGKITGPGGEPLAAVQVRLFKSEIRNPKGKPMPLPWWTRTKRSPSRSPTPTAGITSGTSRRGITPCRRRGRWGGCGSRRASRWRCRRARIVPEWILNFQRRCGRPLAPGPPWAPIACSAWINGKVSSTCPPTFSTSWTRPPSRAG